MTDRQTIYPSPTRVVVLFANLLVVMSIIAAPQLLCSIFPFGVCNGFAYELQRNGWPSSIYFLVTLGVTVLLYAFSCATFSFVSNRIRLEWGVAVICGDRRLLWQDIDLTSTRAAFESRSPRSTEPYILKSRDGQAIFLDHALWSRKKFERMISMLEAWRGVEFRSDT